MPVNRPTGTNRERSVQIHFRFSLARPFWLSLLFAPSSLDRSFVRCALSSRLRLESTVRKAPPSRMRRVCHGRLVLPGRLNAGEARMRYPAACQASVKWTGGDALCAPLCVKIYGRCSRFYYESTGRMAGRSPFQPSFAGSVDAGALLFFLSPGASIKMRSAYFNWLVRLDAAPPLDPTKTSAGFIGINRIVMSETVESKGNLKARSRSFGPSPAYVLRSRVCNSKRRTRYSTGPEPFFRALLSR